MTGGEAGVGGGEVRAEAGVGAGAEAVARAGVTAVPDPEAVGIGGAEAPGVVVIEGAELLSLVDLHPQDVKSVRPGLTMGGRVEVGVKVYAGKYFGSPTNINKYIAGEIQYLLLPHYKEVDVQSCKNSYSRNYG